VQGVDVAQGLMFDKVWLVTALLSTAAIGFQLSTEINLMERASAAHSGDVGVGFDVGEFGAKVEITTPPTALMTQAIIAQPLFSPSRRPKAQENVELAQAADPRPQIVDADLPEIELAGTLISDRVDVALVMDGGRDSRHVRIGDQIADWRIIRIDRDRIELAKDGELHPMPLRKGLPGQRQASPAGRTKD
jgi:hypothetical protein